MRIREWYFQGWTRQSDENGRSRLVYNGEYYAFPGGKRAVLGPAVGLTAGAAALYLAAAFFPSAGGMWRVAAISQLLEIIPLVYLVMGAVCLVRAREPLTFRDHYASWRRMDRASLASGVIAGTMTATELAFLVLHRAEAASPARELLFLGEAAGCAALSLVLYRFIKKHPCSAQV